ncbi:hypothetical protein [Streptomyces bungoensis]|nr:hypothetical protein [Streptomyces bungoensis]
MVEWIDPPYADLVAAWKRRQQSESRDPRESRPVQAFIVQPKT